jgi:peptidylprolyl isomerase
MANFLILVLKVKRKYLKMDPQGGTKWLSTNVFQAGRKDGMIPGFIEGLEKLAIGDKAVVYTFSFSLWRRRLRRCYSTTNIILKVEILESSHNN